MQKGQLSSLLRSRVSRCLLGGVVVFAWIWACGALIYLIGFPSLLAVVLMLALPAVCIWVPKRRKLAQITGGVLITWALVAFFMEKPKRYRDWIDSCRKPPVVRIFKEEQKVVINNVREFKWQSHDVYKPAWVTHTYYLDKLDSLDLIIEPLGDSKLFAHTMLSFGFGPESRVVISVEARKEKGESFSVFSGIYKQFEIFYQINSERDALTLRATEEGTQLYVFPVKASPEFIRSLFIGMAEEARVLIDNPQFYHSLRANCTTKLFDHIRENFDGSIDYGKEILFPASSGRLLHELGWMKTDLDYEAAAERFRLGLRVREFADHPKFSQKIRE